MANIEIRDLVDIRSLDDQALCTVRGGSALSTLFSYPIVSGGKSAVPTQIINQYFDLDIVNQYFDVTNIDIERLVNITRTHINDIDVSAVGGSNVNLDVNQLTNSG